jgi:mannose-6-phosphate isomerase
MVLRHGGWVRLDDCIQQYPVEILGGRVSDTFGARLPFLFKVLAAAEPLSIQAHPDSFLAEEGFERENRKGISIDAPERNYRDAYPKPECLCALTPFWVLCGFRPPQQILELLRVLCPEGLGGELSVFAGQCDAAGLRRLFVSLLKINPNRRQAVIAEANCRLPAVANADLAWITRLTQRYPADIGVLAPALMNVCRLSPGQALYLQAGTLHSYLEGVGIEVMANSDNVVRCGLTPKPVDVTELIRIVRFDYLRVQKTLPASNRTPLEKVYRTPAREFELSVIRLQHGEVFERKGEHSTDIILCTDGRASVREAGADGRRLEMGRGTSVLVPAAAGAYCISGEGELFKATVPQDSARE